MWLINGVLKQDLPASDRSVQYGDGCFTTARVLNGRVVWLERHIQRLQHAAQVLMFPDIDWDLLAAEMQQAAEGKASAVVKAVVTRGVGGRGYSPEGCKAPVRMVMQTDYPVHYENWRRNGISLASSPVKLARSPLLAGIKHLNRLEQVMIRRHLDQQDADEALVLDTHDRLVECCAANLFWRRGKQVFTPDVSQSGVDGLTRRHIMRLLGQSDYHLQVVSAPLKALATADEVIICNALMPLISVNRAEAWCYRSRELYDFLSPNCE